MNIAATASYSAVPSMLTVAPRGMTKLVTLLEMPAFSSRHSIVMGSVAALLAVLNAVATALKTCRKNRRGEYRAKTNRSIGSVMQA